MLILQTDMCVLPFPLIPVVSSVVLGVPLSVVASYCWQFPVSN